MDSNILLRAVFGQRVRQILERAAVDSNLILLSRLLAPGSRLVFTYMHRGALDGSQAFRGARRWKSWVRFGGEPFVFGFEPSTLADTLRRRGVLLQQDASTQELAQAYCAPLGRNEPGSEAHRVAAAVRAEHERMLRISREKRATRRLQILDAATRCLPEPDTKGYLKTANTLITSVLTGGHRPMPKTGGLSQ